MRRELYIDNRLADIDGVSIPLNFACSEIADLSGISGNYSLTVKLPLTGTNIMIAYFANLPNTTPAALWPGYRTTASYFVDGVPIFQNAGVKLLSSEKTIDIQITFGNLTWLDFCEKKKLKDYIQLDQVHHWNYWSIENGTTEVQWVLADYGGTFQDGIHMERMVPAVSVVRIWNNLWSRLFVDGIIKGELTSPALEYDIYLPLQTLTHNPDIPIGEIFTLSTALELSDQTDPIRNTDGFSNMTFTDNHPGMIYVNTNGYFIIPVDGDYRIRMLSSVYIVVTAIGYSQVSVDFNLRLKSDDSVALNIFTDSWIDGTDNESHPFSVDEVISLKKGDQLYLDLYVNQSGVPGYQVYTELTDVEQIVTIDYIPVYNKKVKAEFLMPIDIDYNLPDITCKDFIKAVMQLYGLFIDGKSSSSQVENEPVMFNLDYLLSEKIHNDEFFNWSDKLVSFDRPRIEWNLGLKQNNYLRYTPDETDNIYEDAYFTTYENDNSEKDLFKSIFAASDDVLLIGTSYFPVPCCSVPLWVVDEKTDTWKFEGKAKQRIFRAYLETETTFDIDVVQLYGEEYDPITIDDSFAYISWFKDVPEGITDTGQSLDMDSIMAKYYQTFIASVKSNRLFTFQMFLNAVDINRFVHINPVWIERFSQFYFVKKIVNWEAGRVCNVEMVQLYDAGEVAELPALELTFDDIENVPVINASNVSDWNTYFDLPTNGTPFTSVEVVGDMVRLIGGSNIVLRKNLFNNVTYIISIVDNASSVIVVDELAIFSCTNLTTIYLPFCTYTVLESFYALTALTNINLQSCTDLGGSVGDDGAFSFITGQTITLTIPAALMTCNGGNPDGDIQYLQANNTVTIVTV